MLRHETGLIGLALLWTTIICNLFQPAHPFLQNVHCGWLGGWLVGWLVGWSVGWLNDAAN